MIHRNGFSLVELVIVVAILGILAAIIIPEMSGASVEAKTSALETDLRSVRSQMELYKLHHEYRLPAVAGENSADFRRRMTARTDANGDPGFDYGPYLKTLPVNCFNNLRTIRIDGAAAGANTDGWRFDTLTGHFQADDSLAHAAI